MRIKCCFGFHDWSTNFNCQHCRTPMAIEKVRRQLISSDYAIREAAATILCYKKDLQSYDRVVLSMGTLPGDCRVQIAKRIDNAFGEKIWAAAITGENEHDYLTVNRMSHRLAPDVASKIKKQLDQEQKEKRERQLEIEKEQGRLESKTGSIGLVKSLLSSLNGNSFYTKAVGRGFKVTNNDGAGVILVGHGCTVLFYCRVIDGGVISYLQVQENGDSTTLIRDAQRLYRYNPYQL